MVKPGEFQWLEKADSKAGSSSDPLAEIVLSQIERNQSEASNQPFTIEEFKKIPLQDGLKRLRSSLKSVSFIDEKLYSELRKRTVRSICHKDDYALEIMKNGFLGKNSRFMNLITDMFINTFNPASVTPHECLKDFMYFVFLQLDGNSINEYGPAIQNILINEIFTEPGQISSIKGNFISSLF